ncbi:MAG: phosphonate ABC transporter, permease protein PhnE [Nitrospirae bacterium]|nr:phosphonate ABC transporter, permease protein PhnE [Nitrospirota bacterium]
MEIIYDRLIVQQRQNWSRSLLHASAGLLLVGVCLLYVGIFDARKISEGIPSIVSLIGESLPPNFSDARTWVKPLFDTLAMSIAGTALAIVLSLPLGILAARNTTPHKLAYHMARGILNGLRSIPELIMGILFVAAVGFGALPGVLALGLHSVGMVGKFFSESIEHVDKEFIEAVKSAGASPMQIILHGVLPQVLPQMADVSLYRWEYNFRASTVMGMVGAGGIGTELMGSLRIMQYKDVSALLIIILIMVTFVDGFGTYLRRSFK